MAISVFLSWAVCWSPFLRHKKVNIAFMLAMVGGHIRTLWDLKISRQTLKVIFGAGTYIGTTGASEPVIMSI